MPEMRSDCLARPIPIYRKIDVPRDGFKPKRMSASRIDEMCPKIDISTIQKGIEETGKSAWLTPQKLEQRTIEQQ